MQKFKNKEVYGTFLLLIGAFIWGSTFVAQSDGADKVGPFTFLCLRSILGCAVLLPLALARSCKRKTEKSAPRVLLLGGLACGAVLTVSSLLQQVGISGTSVGNAGFITAMYILIVPIFSMFLGKKMPLRLWGCVGIAVVALYLLTIKDGFSIAFGDLMVLLCAVCFAVHILVIDHVSPKVDGVTLSCIQFATVSVLTVIPMLVIEKPSVDAVLSAWLPIAYAGVLSSGVAYTLQIIGQKYTRPAVASLVMSLESVFAVLSGMVVLGQIPTLKEGIGCVLMFAAIILAQLPQGEKENEKHA